MRICRSRTAARLSEPGKRGSGFSAVSNKKSRAASIGALPGVNTGDADTLGEHAAERIHEPRTDDEFGALAGLEHRRRDDFDHLAPDFIDQLMKASGLPRAESSLSDLPQVFGHVDRQGYKIETAPRRELGKIHRRDEANLMAAPGQPGRKRNRRLNVAARAKGENANLHSGNLVDMARREQGVTHCGITSTRPSPR